MNDDEMQGLGAEGHLAEIESDRLDADPLRDVVGSLHQDEIVAAAGEHGIDPGEPRRGGFAADAVVFHHAVMPPLAQPALEPGGIAAAGIRSVAVARGDAVAESQEDKLLPGRRDGLGGGGEGQQQDGKEARAHEWWARIAGPQV